MTVAVPDHVQPYVEVLGIELAITFLLAFGGAPLYLPASSPRKNSKIAGVIGQELAVELGKRIGSGMIRVPLAKPFIAAHLAANHVPVIEIARRLHVSDVTVYRWVGSAESRQMRLDI